MTTNPTYKRSDTMNIYQISADDVAYVSLSAQDIEGHSSGSVWRFPLPQRIEYNSQYRWSSEDLHQIAADVVKTLSEITDNSIGTTMQKAWDAMGKGGQGLKQMAYRKGAEMLGAGNTQSLVKEMNKVSGNAYNPNEQLYFDGVGLRDFSMMFQLAPMSREEANRMRGAVRAIIERATPGLENEGYYFKYPDYFNLSVVINGNVLLSVKACAITNVSCNFSPEGPFTWHEDGNPVAYNVTISFKESQVITKKTLSNINLLGAPL